MADFHFSLLLRLKITHNFLYLLCAEAGKCRLQSVHHVSPLLLPSPQKGLLTLFPCVTVRFLLQGTVFYELLHCESFPWGAVHQEQTAPACIPHKITSPASKPSLHQSRGPERSLLPMGSQSPSGIHLLQCGVLHRLQEDLCSTMDLPGLQGRSCTTLVCTPGCKGVSALASVALLVPPSALTWVSADLFISHTLIPLSWMQ